MQALPALRAIARGTVELRQVEEVLRRLAHLVRRVEGLRCAREDRDPVHAFEVAPEGGQDARGRAKFLGGRARLAPPP